MNTVAVNFWDDEEEHTAPEPVKNYLEFNTPPLALVLAMQEAGKQTYEIFDTLNGLGKRPHIKADSVVSLENQTKAAEIYDYFAKRHTLRRLKGEYISNFMLAVDDLCENRKKIDDQHIKVLVKLPQFYEQNRQLESVMRGHKSVKKLQNLSFDSWSGEVEFVKQVHIKSSRVNEYQYYFKTNKNYLMRIVLKSNDYGVSAWNALANQGKIHIETDIVYTFHIKGYDFNVLQPSPEHMTIKIL